MVGKKCSGCTGASSLSTRPPDLTLVVETESGPVQRAHIATIGHAVRLIVGRLDTVHREPPHSRVFVGPSRGQPAGGCQKRKPRVQQHDGDRSAMFEVAMALPQAGQDEGMEIGGDLQIGDAASYWTAGGGLAESRASVGGHDHDVGQCWQGMKSDRGQQIRSRQRGRDNFSTCADGGVSEHFAR
ncbi:hypothetical protein BKA80DRAFT_255667 [Phyllosticta citrichinensis]